MPKSKLKLIREALAAQLQEYTGLDSRTYVPDSVTPPMLALIAGNPLAKYDIVIGEQVMGDFTGYTEGVGVKEYNLQILVILSRASSMEQAQEDLDDLVDGDVTDDGKLPIPQAVAIDTTLGGIVDFCVVTSVAQVGPVDISGVTYFSGRVNVNIGA